MFIIKVDTDIGYKFEDGFDVSKFKGCDLVLCGDIHKRQVFDIPGGKKAYMVGSTIQQNFGETVRKHGYGVYTYKIWFGDKETDAKYTVTGHITLIR